MGINNPPDYCDDGIDELAPVETTNIFKPIACISPELMVRLAEISEPSRQHQLTVDGRRATVTIYRANGMGMGSVAVSAFIEPKTKWEAHQNAHVVVNRDGGVLKQELLPGGYTAETFTSEVLTQIS